MLFSRFEDTVRQHADRTAIVFGENSVTYAELDQRVNRIAVALPEGERVVLFLPHGIDFVASLLAVLKCGKTYVPLEQNHPDARLSLILGKVAPGCILTDRTGAGRMQDLAEALTGAVPVLPVEELPESSEAVPVTEDLSAPAYIIFTSGSTGEPKRGDSVS